MHKNWVLAFLASIPWLIIAVLLWYTWPRNMVPPIPTPGTVLIARYPEVYRGLVIALVVSWVAVPLFLELFVRGRTSGVDVAVPLLVNTGLVIALYPMVIVLAHVAPLARFTFAPFTLWVAMLCVAWTETRQEKRNRLPGYAGFSIAFLPVLLLMSVFGSGWRDVAQAPGPDARLYHVQNWSVLMGRANALTEEISRGPLFLRTRVIASAPDEMGIDVLIPREPGAAGMKTTPKQVLLLMDSRWFVFGRRREYKGGDTLAVNLVYDLSSSRLYNYSDLRRAVPTDQPRSWEEVEGILSKTATTGADSEDVP